MQRRRRRQVPLLEGRGAPGAPSYDDGHALVRDELLRFAAALAVALAAVAALTVLASRAASRDVVVDEATRRGEIFARTVSAPLVTAEVRAREADATTTFATVM